MSSQLVPAAARGASDGGASKARAAEARPRVQRRRWAQAHVGDARGAPASRATRQRGARARWRAGRRGRRAHAWQRMPAFCAPAAGGRAPAGGRDAPGCASRQAERSYHSSLMRTCSGLRAARGAAGAAGAGCGGAATDAATGGTALAATCSRRARAGGEAAPARRAAGRRTVCGGRAAHLARQQLRKLAKGAKRRDATHRARLRSHGAPRQRPAHDPGSKRAFGQSSSARGLEALFLEDSRTEIRRTALLRGARGCCVPPAVPMASNGFNVRRSRNPVVRVGERTSVLCRAARSARLTRLAPTRPARRSRRRRRRPRT